VYITTNTEIDARNYFKLGVACIQTPPAYLLDNEATYTDPDENGNPIFEHPNRKSPSVLYDLGRMRSGVTIPFGQIH